MRLTVRDCGAGVPESERDRIFEPFYRPSGRSESTCGWGLGLALVRQIATHHGGSVHYEMSPDGGACFIVGLPSADALRRLGIPTAPETSSFRSVKHKKSPLPGGGGNGLDLELTAGGDAVRLALASHLGGVDGQLV